MQKISDRATHELAVSMLPEIEKALKAVLMGEACHVFTFANIGQSDTGRSWDLWLFMATEFVGAVLEGTAKGCQESSRLFLASQQPKADTQ